MQALLIKPGEQFQFVTLFSTAPVVLATVLGLPVGKFDKMVHEDGTEPEGLTIYCSNGNGDMPHNPKGEEAAQYIFGDLCEVSGPMLIVPRAN